MTVTNTGVTSAVAGTNISVSGATGAVTISTSATPSFATSVTSPLIIGGTAASSSLTLQSTSGVGTSDSILFKVGNNGATTAMTVDTSGNVGIGSSTFNGVKTVVQGSQTGGAPQTSGTTQTYGLLRLIGTSFTSSLDFGTNGGNYAWIQSTDTSNLATNYSLAINPNGGNVGIGTSSPSNTLDVNGTTRFRQELQLNPSGTVQSRIGLSTYTGSSAILAIGNDSGVTANTIAFFNTGSERMRIDSSGNVGIGTSSPSYPLDVNGNVQIQSGNSLYFFSSSYSIRASTGLELKTSDVIRFLNGTTENMRIDSSGDLLVGRPTNSTNNAARIAVSFTQNGQVFTPTTDNKYPICFENAAGTTVGYIYTTSTTTALVSVSDYRLKENVSPIKTGLATVSALKPVTYDWKSDGSSSEGFIAHELQSVIPHAVTGEKDAVNNDGSIKPQGVDYSKIVVHLVAAIQELEARLAKLETVQ